jgi:hypothetical protein
MICLYDGRHPGNRSMLGCLMQGQDLLLDDPGDSYGFGLNSSPISYNYNDVLVDIKSGTGTVHLGFLAVLIKNNAHYEINLFKIDLATTLFIFHKSCIVDNRTSLNHQIRLVLFYYGPLAGDYHYYLASQKFQAMTLTQIK